MESGESVSSVNTNVSGNNGVDQSLENEVERIIQEHNNENVHPKENLPVDPTTQPSKIPSKIPKDALYRGTKTVLPDDFLRVKRKIFLVSKFRAHIYVIFVVGISYHHFEVIMQPLQMSSWLSCFR